MNEEHLHNLRLTIKKNDAIAVDTIVHNDDERDQMLAIVKNEMTTMIHQQRFHGMCTLPSTLSVTVSYQQTYPKKVPPSEDPDTFCSD
jgi:hypothetical protein